MNNPDKFTVFKCLYLNLLTTYPGALVLFGFVSHGCIRMHNADIEDLYSRVMIGTRVVVIQ